MAAQPSLFPATVPVPKWLCLQGRFCKRGVAVRGEPVIQGTCVNRRVTCQTCGRYGEESTRTDL